MFFLEFLKRSVPPEDRVTRSFIEQMVPSLLNNYVIRSAKGGNHQGDETLSEEVRRKFEAHPDQSMFSHQLNGIFPTLRLMNLLEAEGIEQFSSTERCVYIVSYLMHDVDKIDRRPVVTKTREDIEHLKQRIAGELKACEVEQFFPEVDRYLEDIAFLVVNTQQRWNTHLTTYLWRFTLEGRRVAILRRLCTFSDQIAYLVTSPAEILQVQDLIGILEDLSDHQLVFSYHQLREVRGLLTNTINNALINLFTDGHKRGGIWPYLFFSNGVVYITRKKLHTEITTAQIVIAVSKRLQQVCGTRIKQSAPGFKFSIQGIAKHPEYYFEFLSLEDYAKLLVSRTISQTLNDITVTPLEKMRQMQANGEIPSEIALNFEPDKRAGMLARFFSIVFVSVLGMLDKTQQEIREQVEQEIIDLLELRSHWQAAKVIPNKGGVEYRWFWLGLRYLRDHQGQGIEEEYLRELFTRTLSLMQERIGDELRKAMQERQRYLTHLPQYLAATVELAPTIRAEGMLPDFYGELEGYINAKGKGKLKRLICTLCNSEYPTEPHADNSVLFQPWVYKNKLPLYAGANAGGLCAICALELMLRQLLQKGNLRLTGSKFESMKSKYVAVYPNYFFTAETGAMVQYILDQLWDINFFTLRSQLTGKNLAVHDIVHSQMFEYETPSDDEQEPAIISMDIVEAQVEEDTATTIDEEQADKPVKGPTERSYIKYTYPDQSYPGMCFFGMRAGKDDNDTESWAMPALLALALPLVTGAKVVISEMLLPLFSSGHEFLETVLFDAPHTYLARLLGDSSQRVTNSGMGGDATRSRIRINRVLDKLSLLIQVYQTSFETYANKGKPEWQHLSAVVRNLETDPMYVFSYLREQERRGTTAFTPRVAETYIGIYRRVCRELLGKDLCRIRLDMDLEENVGNIQTCVDLYTVFYRGGYETHSILKPVDIVAKAIITSPLEIDKEDPEDLLWQIQGEIQNWLDRVRNGHAAGWAMFRGKEIETKEAPAIREFVTYFYHQVFKVYCQGERGLLRSRLNRFKDGCEAYYKHVRATKWEMEKAAKQAATEVPVTTVQK